MARLRYNGLSTTLGGSLASGATTSVTFAAALTYNGGTNVPTIAGSDYIPLSILDSSGKLAEIVYLTAYTSGGTTGTITRAREGTTGAARASGLKVTHGPLVDDVGVLIATTSYYPNTAVLTSVGTSDGDIDATNLAVTFNAPASGSVILKASLLGISISGANLHISVRQGSSTLVKRRLINGAAQIGVQTSFLVSGLTPGASTTLKLGGQTSSATANAGRFGYGTDGTFTNDYGPAVIEVWAA